MCRHEGVCGGCGRQGLSYPEQLARKRDILRDRLASARIWEKSSSSTVQTLPVFPLAGGPPWHFRRKVAFTFGPGPGGHGLAMGHFARGSQRLIPVSECPVHSERANRIAFALRDHLARARISPVGASPTGVLRHLLIRATRDDREAVAMLVVTHNVKALRKPIRALLESADRPDGFHVNIHEDAGPFMVGNDTIKIDGRAQVLERVGGFDFLISPTAFFQTNVEAAEAMQRHVTEVALSLRPGAPSEFRVLDLYAGSGLFSIPLAARGARVVAIEDNRQAVADARVNMRLNRVSRAALRVIEGRVEDALSRVDRDPWDAVILDPPRHGCPTEVLDCVFGRIAPRMAIYVSCNPDALAAELPLIAERGYRVVDVQLVDMFPHTDHIEAVVHLERSTSG